MKIVDYFSRERGKKTPGGAVQISRSGAQSEYMALYTPLKGPQCELYDSIRQAIPLVDAAIDKVIRLVGRFTVVAKDEQIRQELERFSAEVAVGGGQRGLHCFLEQYLDSLITYGNAVGEMLLAPDCTAVAAVCSAPPENVRIRCGEDPTQVQFLVGSSGAFRAAENPELILFTPLRPKAGEAVGISMLAGLPFVSDVLQKIYQSTGNNFERVGSLRYAVTYRPTGSEQADSQEIAQSIAKGWSAAMEKNSAGRVSDFVAVGDVAIKVIGADNQLPETEVPVRQMLEQIVAKMGIPPFMLGLHWSSTERMSHQQADILTSELEYYRQLLTPVVRRIFEMHLGLRGMAGDFDIDWNIINLQDEAEMAQTRLLNAQAEMLEREMEGVKVEQ